MVSSRATTVAEYLKSLPADRREAVETVRNVILKNLPAGYEEGVQYGMLGYYIPLSRYPNTYNGQPLAVAGLASQKQYLSLYLMGVYGDPKLAAWFEKAYAASGKKLDMGKSCVRFKTVDALPLDVVGETIAKLPPEEFIAMYETVRGSMRTNKEARAKAAATKGAKKKPAAKRSAPRKRAVKQTPKGRAGAPRRKTAR